MFKSAATVMGPDDGCSFHAFTRDAWPLEHTINNLRSLQTLHTRETIARS